MATVEIVSFGYLHQPPPDADRVEDVRPFRDPHLHPRLRHMTADDWPVRDTVLSTPGVRDLIRDLAAWVNAQAETAPLVRLAVGCAGGRHRAPTVAREVAAHLITAGHAVTVRHRDMDKPVIRLDA